MTSRIRDLPEWLRNIGLRIFSEKNGGFESFERFLIKLETSQRYRVNVAGIDVWLATTEGVRDSAVQMLMGNEGRGKDQYGLNRLMQDMMESHQLGYDDRGVIVDIGANLGDFSIAAAKLFPSLQIIAFEPVPTTFFAMNYNFWINGITLLDHKDLKVGGKGGVVAVHAAIADKNDVREVFWNSEQTNLAFVDPMTLAETHGKRIKEMTASQDVRGVVLEDFLKQHDRLDRRVLFLKMDCEGCEFDALPSMKDLFVDRSRVRYIGMEYHQSLLRTAGYTYARKASAQQQRSSSEILRVRGCEPQHEWILWC